MKYYCVECGCEFTIPQGDYLIDKKQPCKCGRSAELLKIKKMIIIEGYETRIPFLKYS